MNWIWKSWNNYGLQSWEIMHLLMSVHPSVCEVPLSFMPERQLPAKFEQNRTIITPWTLYIMYTVGRLLIYLYKIFLNKSSKDEILTIRNKQWKILFIDPQIIRKVYIIPIWVSVFHELFLLPKNILKMLVIPFNFRSMDLILAPQLMNFSVQWMTWWDAERYAMQERVILQDGNSRRLWREDAILDIVHLFLFK